MFITLDFITFDGFLLLEVATEVFITSLLEFLQLLFLKDSLMLVSLFLVFEFLVGCLLHLPPSAFDHIAT